MTDDLEQEVEISDDQLQTLTAMVDKLKAEALEREKEHVKKIRRDFGLDSDTPNVYRILDFVNVQATEFPNVVELMAKGYSLSGDQYTRAISHESILNDPMIDKVMQKYSDPKLLEYARKNLHEARLFVGITSTNERIVSEAFSETLNLDNYKERLILAAEKIKIFPDDVLERLKELNDVQINLELMYNRRLPQSYRDHLIDSGNPVYLCEIFEKNFLSSFPKAFEKMANDFSDEDIKAVLPSIGEFCKMNSLIDHETGEVFEHAVDFYERCCAIPDLSQDLMEHFNRMEINLVDCEYDVEQEPEIG